MVKMAKKFQVRVKDLIREPDTSIFSFKTTGELAPLDNVIGQKRAVGAIDFGLNMKSSGYNIFVTGYEGTGKINHCQGYPQPVCRAIGYPA